MGKGKMSLLDVSAIVKELHAKLVGLRVANIYHLNPRTYLLKLSSSSQKLFLLIESGVRIHTTAYLRDHDALPNQFASKLRKHIRMLRLEDVRQMGADRVVDLLFGRGERRCHLIIEMYAQGNIVLTDADYQIVMVLRVHQYGDGSSAVQGQLQAAEGGAREQKEAQVLREDERSVEAEEEEEAIDDDNFDEIERRGEAKEKQQSIAASLKHSSSDRVAVRSVYPYHRAQQPQRVVTREMIMQIIQLQVKKQQEEDAALQRQEEEKERQEQQIQHQAEHAEDEAEVADSIAGQQRPGKKDKRKKPPSSSKPAVKARRKSLRLPPLKAVFAGHLHYGPEVIEHCLLRAGLNGNDVVDVSRMLDADVDRIVSAFGEAPSIMERVEKEMMKGWIVVREEGGKDVEIKKPKGKKKHKAGGDTKVEEQPQQQTATATQTAQSESPHQTPTTTEITSIPPPRSSAFTSSFSSSFNPSRPPPPPPPPPPSALATIDKQDATVSVYSEFLPILLAQHSRSLPGGDYNSAVCRLVEFVSLDAAIDEFYSKQEEQREELRLMREKAAALHKIERVKVSHEKQLSVLHSQQEDNRRKAELIEINTAAVDAAIASINTELARGTDWKDLQRIIKQEKAAGNVVAMLVAHLKLEENTVTLSLSPDLAHLHPSFSYASATPEQRPVKVDIDLSLSAFNNASLYYSTKKRQAVKAERTSEASEKAVRAAEKRTAAALKEVDVRSRIQRIRRVFWWEKFHWFITSENYLVIGGKDAQQNELVVKRHLQRDDLYVHADVHGASSVVIKNPSSAAVPPLSIQQAATMCICRSSAWKAKHAVQVEAYWVHADQVSKTAPSGMFLTVGSFMVRGKKNFISRMPMVMGLGVLFRLEDECIDRHRGERRVKGIEGEAERVKDGEGRNEKGKKGSAEVGGEEEDGGRREQEAEETSRGAVDVDDDDFDVTSAMVRGLSLHGEDRQLALSDLSSEGDSEMDREASEHQEEKKDGAGAKKRLSAAEKRRLKKAAEKAMSQHDRTIPAVDPSTARSAEAEDGGGGQEAPAESIEDEKVGASKRTKAKGKKGETEEKAGKEAAQSGQLSRGKRSKLKKIAKRYGQQDEEDLLIAASVLGLQNVDKKKREIQKKEREERGRAKQPQTAQQQDQMEAEDGEEADGEGEEAEQRRDVETNTAGMAGAVVGRGRAKGRSDRKVEDANDGDRVVCYLCKQRGHLFKNCPVKASQQLQTAASDPSAASTTSTSPELLTFSAARRLAEAAEQTELEALAAEENISTSSASSSPSSPLSLVNTLTARPVDADVLQFAVCVCAPYSALSDYKCRVKLVPGSQKKGKLCQAALGVWMRQSGVTEAEREMLRGMREDEMMAVLLSNVKLAAGLAGELGKKKRREVTVEGGTDKALLATE